MKLEKCFKVIFPHQLIIIPFEGNLTETKKQIIANSVLNVLVEDLNKNVTFDDVYTVIFHKAYGSVEKNVEIEDHGERTSLSGEGWSSSNFPNGNLFILDSVCVI